MQRYQTLTGFVTGRQQLGEADRILRLFTREQGRVDVIARGIRRSNARLASRTEPFFEVEWRIVAGRQLPVVTGAEVLQAPERTSSLEALALGQSLLELTERSFQAQEPSSVWYELLSSAFAELATNPHPLIWTTALSRSLDQLGLSPELPQPARSVRIRLHDGRIDADSGEAFDLRIIKLWRACQQLPLARLLRIQGLQNEPIELGNFLERFWLYHTGASLHSRQLA